MENLRKHIDYSATAVNLCNPLEVGQKLFELRDAQARARTLDANLQALPEYQELQAQQQVANDLDAEIRKMVDAMGSYQDTSAGLYAVKQRRESIAYKPELVRNTLAPNFANLVIVEAVDNKALEGLVKGGLVTQEQARQCGEVKETFAFIIR